jgi:hypothetical protein
MLWRGKIPVCSKNHAENLNAICGQDAELLNLELSGDKHEHWALKDKDLQLPYGNARGGSRFCGT